MELCEQCGVNPQQPPQKLCRRCHGRKLLSQLAVVQANFEIRWRNLTRVAVDGAGSSDIESSAASDRAATEL
jgi:DnaJ-class molecular chaperone